MIHFYDCEWETAYVIAKTSIPLVSGLSAIFAAANAWSARNTEVVVSFNEEAIEVQSQGGDFESVPHGMVIWNYGSSHNHPEFYHYWFCGRGLVLQWPNKFGTSAVLVSRRIAQRSGLPDLLSQLRIPQRKLERVPLLSWNIRRGMMYAIGMAILGNLLGVVNWPEGLFISASLAVSVGACGLIRYFSEDEAHERLVHASLLMVVGLCTMTIDRPAGVQDWCFSAFLLITHAATFRGILQRKYEGYSLENAIASKRQVSVVRPKRVLDGR